MARTKHDNLKRAVTLPVKDRAELVAESIATLDGEPEDYRAEAGAAEIARRAASVDAGTTRARESTEIRRDLGRRNP